MFDLGEGATASLVTGVIGLIGTVLAYYISKGKTKEDFAVQLRTELRGDIGRWKDAADRAEKRAKELEEYFDRKVKELYAEIDEWRKKFNLLDDTYNRVEEENRDLRKENDVLTRSVSELTSKVEKLNKALKDNNINGF